ncbi:uncharacterized protein LOC141663772 isoform X1 [Apium graveolens]|uniref:uncharacterized protein LOC141663769 isoform X1 n=2 Tax=Apium graveolens TaxID=4045 RepID=UPI003D78E961
MKRKSIQILVHIVSWPGVEPVLLDGFKSSDTIYVVVERLFQTATDVDLGYPNCGKVLSPDGFVMHYNETLQSLLDLGYGEWSTYLSYIPVMEKESPPEHKLEFDWLAICERVRLGEEAHMEHIGNRRPKSIPFVQLSGVRIHGQYQLLDSNNNLMPDSSIRIAVPVPIQTNASVILLATSDKILKDLISFNDKSKYLVVGVSWDILSYLFLTTLRASYPDIPIVAVTDLNPHHLDLLTFLDTPLKKLPCCYGWDLSGESRDENNVDSVNIKWLGVRPCDCKSRLSYDGASCYPSGFREVTRMLRANPIFRAKKDWLAALSWLDVFGKSVTFHPLAPGDVDPNSADCHLYLGDFFVAKKLRRRDWV